MLLSPTATTMDNGGYEPLWTTFNTDCAQAAGRFYCAKGANSVEVIDLDLKRPCIVNSISYKWQDNAVDPTYKLKIEVSLDGETYTTLYDSVDYVAGQVFVAETTSETRTVRYVRFTAQSTAPARTATSTTTSQACRTSRRLSLQSRASTQLKGSTLMASTGIQTVLCGGYSILKQTKRSSCGTIRARLRTSQVFQTTAPITGLTSGTPTTGR